MRKLRFYFVHAANSSVARYSDTRLQFTQLHITVWYFPYCISFVFVLFRRIKIESRSHLTFQRTEIVFDVFACFVKVVVMDLDTKVPALPVDKEYHLFVCYTAEHAGEVRVIVDNLEREGVKCCYHERDFVAGHGILESMYETIKKSMHMLVVLSEDFSSRGFCVHEVEQALHEKINSDYSIIPIKIGPCDVPDILKHLTYIDAVNEIIENVHWKVINALVKAGKYGIPSGPSRVSWLI